MRASLKRKSWMPPAGRTGRAWQQLFSNEKRGRSPDRDQACGSSAKSLAKESVEDCAGAVEADEMRVRHTKLPERTDLLEGGQPAGAALHNPVDYMAGVAFALEQSRIDSALGEKLRLARRDLVFMGDKRISKSGLTRTLRRMELCVVPLAALRWKHGFQCVCDRSLSEDVTFPERARPILDERRHKRQTARLDGTA